MDKYKQLFKDININITNLKLLNEAFTHHSYCEKIKSEECLCYRRLEILGDSIIGKEVILFLYENSEKYNRSIINNYKQQLISNNNLMDIGNLFNLSFYLLYDESKYKLTFDTICANLLESLISVIYLEKGEDVVKNFIRKNVCKKQNTFVFKNINDDPKSFLNIYFRKEFNIIPEYKKIGEEKLSDNTWNYEVVLYNPNNDVNIYKGIGKSIKGAQKNAAKKYIDINNIK